MHQYCTQMWAVLSVLITQSVQTEIILTEESGLTVYTYNLLYCAKLFSHCFYEVLLKNSSPASMETFLWTLAAFSLIASKVIPGYIYREQIEPLNTQL